MEKPRQYPKCCEDDTRKLNSILNIFYKHMYMIWILHNRTYCKLIHNIELYFNMSYRQSHALYVLHEIKWIVCQCIVFIWKYAFLFHMIEIIFFSFLLMRKKYFDRKVLKFFFTSTMKIPDPTPNKKVVVALHFRYK